MTDNNNLQDSTKSDNKIILGYVKTIIKYITDENLYETKEIDYNFYIETIKTKFNDFSIRYPALFNMVVENPKNFEYDRLIYMLNLKNNIDKNITTHETASVRIGQEYYDEFVKKTVSNLE